MKSLRRALPWALLAAGLLCALAALIPVQPAPDGAISAQGRTEPLAEIAAIPLPDGTVDVNTNDLYELTELPGVGETIARRILDEREANGDFFFPEDLLAVPGIGPAKKTALLKRFHSVYGIARAAEEDIAAVAGVGAALAAAVKKAAQSAAGEKA